MREAPQPLTAASETTARRQATRPEARLALGHRGKVNRVLRSLFAFAQLLLLAVPAASCRSGTEPSRPKATKLVLLTAPSATAETMVPLGVQPILQAADEGGIPVPSAATVTADVVSGNGAVMAGGSMTTDASGRAAFSGLTLGAVNGQVGALKLRFTAPGLDSVTADVELRCAVLPLAIGQTVNRALTTGDCTHFAKGAFNNVFEITTSQPVTPVQLTADATFASSLVVKGPNERDYWGWSRNTPGGPWGFKALLAPGPNRLALGAVFVGSIISIGTYSLTAAAATEDLTCDFPEAVATSPITTTQQLSAGDCSSDSFLEDRLLVGLPPNASLTASMTTSAFQPHLQLIDGITEEVLADASAGGTASVVFANGSTGKIGELVLSSEGSGSSGPYTLSLDITYPSVGAVTDAAGLLWLPMLDATMRDDHSRRIGVARLSAAARQFQTVMHGRLR